VWHPGSTRGSSAFLHVRPGRWAVAVVANGPGADSIGKSVVDEIFAPDAYTEAVGGPELAIEDLVGTFDRRYVRHEISIQQDELEVSTTYEARLGISSKTLNVCDSREVGPTGS
jgi:hypothetical protein